MESKSDKDGEREVEGLHLVGKFVRAYKGKAYTGKTGEPREPITVEVRCGQDLSRVEYRSVEDARTACGGIGEGQPIVLRVAAYPKSGAKGLWVSLQGWVERSDEQETVQL
jgi:hypothetical protein